MKNKLLLLAVIFLPKIVLADMGAPTIPSYQATVNNPNGITIENKKIEYGTEVTVRWEEYFNGLNKTICYVEDYGETPCSNLIPVDKEFDLNDALKKERVVRLNKINNATVINSKVVDLYKGPGVSYEKIGNVPANTKFTVEYISGGDSASSDAYITSAVWIYINTKNYKGWIYALECNIGYTPEVDELFLAVDSIVVSDSNKELFKIPANTIVKAIYDTDDWSRLYYIEYKNQKGFLSHYDVANKVSGTITIHNNKNLLSYANADNKGVLEKLDSNTTYNYTYAYGDYGDNWFYVTTKSGKQGWIYTSDMLENDVDITYDDESIEPTTKFTTELTTNSAVNNTPIENEIIMYILIALVVVLSAIVIMLLINRKNIKK